MADHGHHNDAVIWAVLGASVWVVLLAIYGAVSLVLDVVGR